MDIQVGHQIPRTRVHPRAERADEEGALRASVAPAPDHTRHIVTTADAVRVRDASGLSHPTQARLLNANVHSDGAAGPELLQHAEVLSW